MWCFPDIVDEVVKSYHWSTVHWSTLDPFQGARYGYSSESAGKGSMRLTQNTFTWRYLMPVSARFRYLSRQSGPFKSPRVDEVYWLAWSLSRTKTCNALYGAYKSSQQHSQEEKSIGVNQVYWVTLLGIAPISASTTTRQASRQTDRIKLHQIMARPCLARQTVKVSKIDASHDCRDCI